MFTGLGYKIIVTNLGQVVSGESIDGLGRVGLQKADR